jgi:hypothetical protein
MCYDTSVILLQEYFLLNPEVKTEFVAALRSGKYKQGSGRLKEKDCFCVYGVLCDLYLKKHNKRWVFSLSRFFAIDSSLYPPKEVLEWADLKEDQVLDCVIDDEQREEDLMSLNDSHFFSFKILADLIQEQL